MPILVKKVEFLINSGLPTSHKDHISFKSNGSVMVDMLDNQLRYINSR